jgi:hypothetical protein
VGEVHQLLLDYGKRAALDSEFDRTVVEAAAAYLANEDTEIGVAARNDERPNAQ